MGKKQVAVSLRKPPPTDPDAFVANGEAPVSPLPRTAEGPAVVTRTGERREITVYLPTDLARQLSVRCLELDRDVSNVVAEALAGALANEQEIAVKAPPDVWDRARAVIADLRARFPLLRMAMA
jgi:hypothetical protein